MITGQRQHKQETLKKNAILDFKRINLWLCTGIYLYYTNNNKKARGKTNLYKQKIIFNFALIKL